jgi:hypothetical protein
MSSLGGVTTCMRLAAAGAAALLLAGFGPPPDVRGLDGGRIADGGAPVVMVFWRADCAPCLLELRNARAYAEAARPGRLLFVGLQAADPLRRAAQAAGAPAAMIARMDDAPAEVLTAYGGAPPRLPLAVAFDGSGGGFGRVCGRHTGLLGTEQVRAWVRKCGGVDARG